MQALGWLIRILVMLPLVYLLYCSQRFWVVRAGQFISGGRGSTLRRLLKAGAILLLLALLLPGLIWIVTGSRRPLPDSMWFAASGLWLSSAFVAWISVRAVAGLEWIWNRRRALRMRQGAAEVPPDTSRRYFFQTAGYVAGAVPFVGAFYGFIFERLHYRVERVEVPVSGLPEALDGLRIVQLSDIHSGGYMPRDQIRRAVDMANELGAQLAVVTGDFITGRNDPLEECVQELAGLRMPLGVWGCNGNHEIYAGVEAQAASLFAQGGMRLLRQENAELVWKGQPFNLIGVDYQRNRGPLGGNRFAQMLPGIEPLIRPAMPNILLSHNPNAFLRAAELGIPLTLAGHTHGGQIQVEILHERLNPARFFTEFVAGLYQRPLRFASGAPTPDFSRRIVPAGSQAFLYVNRGLGTIGTPVRFGAPPEITLLTLRRA